MCQIENEYNTGNGGLDQALEPDQIPEFGKGGVAMPIRRFLSRLGLITARVAIWPIPGFIGVSATIRISGSGPAHHYYS